MAFFMAAHGASVTGIDISPVAVEQGRRRAAADHVADQVTFEVIDAESLQFPDGTFDLVCGSGVLHHLDLSREYTADSARVLQPHGTAVFVEPLGHNPLINAYRRRTPALRTVDEHPLLLRDLEQAREHFAKLELKFFHLASLAATPFRNRRGFERVLAALDRLDRVLFRIAPPLRRHAWMVVMRMDRGLFKSPRRFGAMRGWSCRAGRTHPVIRP